MKSIRVGVAMLLVSAVAQLSLDFDAIVRGAHLQHIHTEEIPFQAPTVLTVFITGAVSAIGHVPSELPEQFVRSSSESFFDYECGGMWFTS